jgi:hypothetical protein
MPVTVRGPWGPCSAGPFAVATAPGRPPAVSVRRVHGLDDVAVGVQDERTVVARVVLRPLAGSALVAVPGLDQRGVERPDRRLVGRGEGDVHVTGRLAGDERERAAPRGDPVERRPVRRVVDELVAGVGCCRGVEVTGRGDVGDADPQVVDVPVRPLAVAVDGLDAVAVGVAQERAVVRGAVLRPRPGRPVVGVPGGGAGAPERVDGVAGRRRERQVEPGRRGPPGGHVGEREVVPLGEPLATGGRTDAQRPQDRGVEALRGAAVGDAQGHVVEHGRECGRATRRRRALAERSRDGGRRASPGVRPSRPPGGAARAASRPGRRR